MSMHILKQLLPVGALAIALAGCGAAPAATPSASALPSVAASPSSSPSAAASPSSAPSAAGSPSSAPSAAASPSSAPSAAATTVPAASQNPAEAQDGPNAAAQRILDYYAAIRTQQYAQAYAMWAGDGAASNQSSGDFANGYENTVEVSVQLGQPSGDGSSATVPVDVIAIRNDASEPTTGQRVEHFTGSYMLTHTADRWEIASAQIAPAADASLPPAGRGDALELLKAYYAAINAGEYGRAYTLWNGSGQGSGQSLAQFVAGFADTVSVAIATGAAQGGAAAGSAYTDVPVVIVATQRDGSTASYCGTYTLRRLNVPPFDQLGWRIETAKIGPTSDVAIDSPEASALLSGGCGAQ